jgi:hypothetical protein
MGSLSESTLLSNGVKSRPDWSDELKLITDKLSSSKDTSWQWGAEHEVILYDKTTDTAYRAPNKVITIDEYQRAQLTESEQQFLTELALFFFRMHSKGWPERPRTIIEIEIAKYDHRFDPDDCYIQKTFVSNPLREDKDPSFVALQVLRAVNMGSVPYDVWVWLDMKELDWLADSEDLVFTDDIMNKYVAASNEPGSRTFEIKALPITTAQREQIANDGDKIFGRTFREAPVCTRELDGSISVCRHSRYLGIRTKMTEQMLRACTDRIEYTYISNGTDVLDYVGPKLGSQGKAWTRPADWHGEHGFRISFEPDGSAQVRSIYDDVVIVSACAKTAEKKEDTLPMPPGRDLVAHPPQEGHVFTAGLLTGVGLAALAPKIASALGYM